MEIDENGVVNPLRAPAFVSDGFRSVRSIPPVGLVFLGLAGIVLATSVMERRSFDLILVGRAVTVVLPAALLWRRPDAASVTPRLFRGSLLVAVAVIAATFIQFVSAAIPADDSFVGGPAGGWPRVIASVVVTVMTLVGWALTASGVARLRAPRGAGTRALAAIVAACAVAVGAGMVFLDLGAQGFPQPALLIPLAILEAVSWIVTAYLGWVLVSRAGGSPRRATIAAALGVAIQIIGSLPVVAIALGIQATQPPDVGELQANGFAVLAAASLLAPILFVFALASGLGDPPAQAEPA